MAPASPGLQLVQMSALPLLRSVTGVIAIRIICQTFAMHALVCMLHMHIS